MDYDSTIEYLESIKIDYIETEGCTTMYQKKLYVGDFIQDIMIENSYIHDDMKLLKKILPNLNSDLIAARIKNEIKTLEMILS